MTRLIDLPTLAQLVHDITPARFMTELAEHLRSDYLRWPDFDKTARVASHSMGCPRSWPLAYWPMWPPVRPCWSAS